MSVSADDPNMETNLREAMLRTKDDLELTNEEEARLTKAFKEPEFKKLMADYMAEISDPKNKAEYDAYINQLEKDNKVPKGTKLVRPDAGFCVKCKKQGSGEKVFVNICSAPDVDVATSQNTPKGQSWQLPHMMGPPHMEQDKSKTPCMTFDICFHTDTLKRSAKNVRFQKLLVQTALETIQEKTNKYGQKVSLESNFRILKGVKAMGGKPNMLSVKVDNVAAEGVSAAKTATNNNNEKQATKKTEKNKTKRTGKNDASAANDMGALSCVVVERGHFDMRNFLSEGNRNRVNRHRPQELVIKIKMPGVKSMASVELDVSERELVLVVPGEPKFVRRLPYPVNGDEGSAKFLRKTSTLQVVVPVLPPVVEELEAKEEAKEEEAKEEMEASKPVMEEVINTEAASSTGAVAPVGLVAAPTASAVGHVVASADEPAAPSAAAEALKPPREASIPAGLDSDMMEKIRQAREAYSNWAKKGNDKDEEDAVIKAKEAAAAAKRSIETSSQGTLEGGQDGVADGPNFVAAAKFSGTRKGYVFKKGGKGCGYYVDTRYRKKRTPIAAAAAASGPEISVVEEVADEKRSCVDLFDAEPTLSMPPHRFRQDLRTLTLLIQVESIDEESTSVMFTPKGAVVSFAAGGKQYGLRVCAPKDRTLLPTQSRFNVSDRNMAVIIAKEQAEKWGAEMNIEAIQLSDTAGKKEDEAVEDEAGEEAVGAASASTVGSAEVNDGGLGGASMLSNTLMYDLS